ncbi:MAG: EAL domain-containing protein [Hyphomicrobiales bacterium]|nr:MAG: EAL domain-containing protein [Hyphomicrobiales bacterium]
MRRHGRLVAGSVAAVGVLALFCLYMHHQYVSAIERSRRDLQGLAYALSEHLEDLVKAVDFSLTRLVERSVHCQPIGIMARPDALPEAQRILRGVQSISVLNQSGEVIQSTWRAALGMDRSNSTVFKTLQSSGTNAMVLDSPFQSVLTGKVLIPMGRRLSSGSDFCGAVVALIEPERLSPIYLSLDAGTSRTVWLLRGEKIVARFGGLDNSSPTLPGQGLSGTGFKIITDPSGAGDLLVAHDAVGETPLTIATAVTLADVLADWRRDLYFGLFSFTCVGLLAFLAIRIQHREQSKAALRDAELKRQSEARRILFETSLDIILVLSEDRRVLQVSPSIESRLGIAPSSMIGQPFSEALGLGHVRDIEAGLDRARDSNAMHDLETCLAIEDCGKVWLSWSIVWSESVRNYFLIGHDRTDVKAREEQLVTQNHRLDAALENMSQALAMFDKDGRLLVANDKFATSYGQRPDEVKPGMLFTDIVARRIELGLYKGDTVEKLQAHMHQIIARQTETSFLRKLGDGRTMAISIQPQPDGGWVATHLDVTDKEVLREHLDTALNNMAQGLAMFDKDQRLVLSNEKFASMYGQSPNDVKPGMHLGELIAHRIANGTYVGTTVEEVLEKMRERVSRQKVSYITGKMGDGRTIAVAIQPKPDGGWVSTHLDITERESLNDRLDAAINNMAQGLVMFDANQRLVLCNTRYLELYELPKEMVQPGIHVLDILRHCTNGGVYAGRDADQMYEATRQQVSASRTGYYETRLSDGRIYGVSVRPMGEGGLVATHEDITERRRIEAKIAHLAHHDALTDLPNRALLRKHLEASCASRSPLGVLYLDLDRFKPVNDTLGHAVGDKLLRAVAERLKSCLRDGDLVARLGGDEFAVLVYGTELHVAATAISRRIITALNTPFDIDGHVLSIGTSIGIAIAPNDGEDADQVLKNADLALYAAKTEHRGTFSFFEKSMNERLMASQILELELRNALVNKEFFIEYQPIYDLATGEISACEALLRWKHPRKGRVPPIDFIPHAEQTGLIVEIGAWVLHEACAEAATWPSHVKLAVNLSPVQARAPGIVNVVKQALDASWLPPERLELEITETTLLGNNEQTLRALSEIYALGAHIALDDFGTGYSSLSYLQIFPFHKIKVDRSFISAVQEGNPVSHALLRTIAFLGTALGMVTTVEGVETEEQLAYLRQEKFDQGQGYYFSRPLAPEALPWHANKDGRIDLNAAAIAETKDVA